MKTPINIHISSVERLYSDGLITDAEYKAIIDRIIAERMKEKAGEDGG